MIVQDERVDGENDYADARGGLGSAHHGDGDCPRHNDYRVRLFEERVK